MATLPAVMSVAHRTTTTRSRVGVNAHAPRLRLAHGQQIHPPAQQPQRNQPHKNRKHGKLHVTRLDGRQRAHQPVGNGRQLIGWVCHQFNKRSAGGEQRADHHARQHHRKRRLDFADARNEIRQQHRQKSKAKRQPRDRAVTESEQKPQRRAEARARRCAEQIRRDHGVAEHALIGTARRGKRRADQRCRCHPRQTDVDHHRLLARLPGLYQKESSPAYGPQQPVQQNPQRLHRRYVIPPHPERAEKHQAEAQRQNRKFHSRTMRFFHAEPSIVF